MATRILIICKSQDVPGANADKTLLVTNEACQKVWGRDFDEAQGDRLAMEGEFLFGIRCCLLVDNGPVESTEYTTLFFKWNKAAQELVLVPGALHPYIRNKFRERFQFNPADRPKPRSYTGEEYKEAFGVEKYEALVKAKAERAELVRRFGP